MAKRGFGFVVAAAIVVGLAAGTVLAVVVASGRNRAQGGDTKESAVTTGSGSGTAAAEGSAAQAAESLNDEGRAELKAANGEKAARLFQLAHKLVPNARYAFNTALAYEISEDYVTEMTWLLLARNEKPEPKLAAKIEHRIKVAESARAAPPVSIETRIKTALRKGPFTSEMVATASNLNEQGRKKLLDSKFAEASLLFEQAIEVVPDPRYQYDLATSTFQEARFDQTIFLLRRLLAQSIESRLRDKCNSLLGRAEEELRAAAADKP